MTGNLFNINNLKTILISSFLSVFVSLSILLLAPNYLLAFILVSVPFFIIFVLKKPFILLQILILIMPFTVTSILNVQLMGVPGLKVINILFVLTVVSFIISKIGNNINFYEKLFVVGMMFILLIAVIRSLPQIQVINQVWGDSFSYGRFIQTFFFKSIIYFSLFIFIAMYVSTFSKVELLLKTYVFSMFNLSVFILVVYVFFTPDKNNFSSVRENFGSILHLHGNSLGTIYVTSFPIIVSSFFIKKNWLTIATLILSVIVIGLSYSRTAYFLVVLSFFMYLFISKRLNMVPILSIFLIILIQFIPSTITERALTGIEDKDVYQISAGRVSTIWAPVANELLESPKKLFFGIGINGYVLTDAFKRGLIFPTSHAHNLYLDTILNMGLFAVSIFMMFYMIFVKNIIKAINFNSNEADKNEILFGVLVSTLSFLLAGLTGRQFFPSIFNYPFWIMLGFGSAILKIYAKNETA